MTSKEPYTYVALRYIHDVFTGEFVNVGLVMVVPNRLLILSRTCKVLHRLKSVFPDMDGDAYKSAVDAIDRGMENVQSTLKDEGHKDGRNARDYARIALPHDDSSLQWSHAGGGLTADPHKTFEQLYQRFVSRYDHAPKRQLPETVTA